MEETLLIHGLSGDVQVWYYPYIHILGEEDESLRVGRREVVVGGLSGVCIAFSSSLQADGQAGIPDCYCL